MSLIPRDYIIGTQTKPLAIETLKIQFIPYWNKSKQLSVFWIFVFKVCFSLQCSDEILKINFLLLLEKGVRLCSAEFGYLSLFVWG